MGFKTRIDYSDNRQIKQRTYTSTDLSGTTVFGIDYSGLTAGVDLDTVIVTSTLANVDTTFSGDSFQTIFTFPDSRMVVASESIEVITNLNSGTTQTALGYEPTESTEIDGNTVNLAYTGATFDFTVTEISEDNFLGWSGTANSTVVTFLSGSSLDFQERTIWADVKGIIQTKRLIITDELDTDNTVTKVLVKQSDGDVVEKDITFFHDQGIPATVWNIEHNLSKYPSITVIDTANSIVEGAVKYIDINNVEITFNSAFSGSAICN